MTLDFYSHLETILIIRSIRWNFLFALPFADPKEMANQQWPASRFSEIISVRMLLMQLLVTLTEDKYETKKKLRSSFQINQDSLEGQS